MSRVALNAFPLTEIVDGSAEATALSSDEIAMSNDSLAGAAASGLGVTVTSMSSGPVGGGGARRPHAVLFVADDDSDDEAGQQGHDNDAHGGDGSGAESGAKSHRKYNQLAELPYPGVVYLRPPSSTDRSCDDRAVEPLSKPATPRRAADDNEGQGAVDDDAAPVPRITASATGGTTTTSVVDRDAPHRILLRSSQNALAIVALAPSPTASAATPSESETYASSFAAFGPQSTIPMGPDVMAAAMEQVIEADPVWRVTGLMRRLHRSRSVLQMAVAVFWLAAMRSKVKVLEQRLATAVTRGESVYAASQALRMAKEVWEDAEADAFHVAAMSHGGFLVFLRRRDGASAVGGLVAKSITEDHVVQVLPSLLCRTAFFALTALFRSEEDSIAFGQELRTRLLESVSSWFYGETPVALTANADVPWLHITAQRQRVAERPRFDGEHLGRSLEAAASEFVPASDVVVAHHHGTIPNRTLTATQSFHHKAKTVASSAHIQSGQTSSEVTAATTPRVRGESLRPPPSLAQARHGQVQATQSPAAALPRPPHTSGASRSRKRIVPTLRTDNAWFETGSLRGHLCMERLSDNETESVTDRPGSTLSPLVRHFLRVKGIESSARSRASFVKWTRPSEIDRSNTVITFGAIARGIAADAVTAMRETKHTYDTLVERDRRETTIAHRAVRFAQGRAKVADEALRTLYDRRHPKTLELVRNVKRSLELAIRKMIACRRAGSTTHVSDAIAACEFALEMLADHSAHIRQPDRAEVDAIGFRCALMLRRLRRSHVFAEEMEAAGMGRFEDLPPDALQALDRLSQLLSSPAVGHEPLATAAAIAQGDHFDGTIATFDSSYHGRTSRDSTTGSPLFDGRSAYRQRHPIAPHANFSAEFAAASALSNQASPGGVDEDLDSEIFEIEREVAILLGASKLKPHTGATHTTTMALALVAPQLPTNHHRKRKNRSDRTPQSTNLDEPPPIDDHDDPTLVADESLNATKSTVTTTPEVVANDAMLRSPLRKSVVSILPRVASADGGGHPSSATGEATPTRAIADHDSGSDPVAALLRTAESNLNAHHRTSFTFDAQERPPIAKLGPQSAPGETAGGVSLPTLRTFSISSDAFGFGDGDRVSEQTSRQAATVLAMLSRRVSLFAGHTVADAPATDRTESPSATDGGPNEGSSAATPQQRSSYSRRESHASRTASVHNTSFQAQPPGTPGAMSPSAVATPSLADQVKPHSRSAIVPRYRIVPGCHTVRNSVDVPAGPLTSRPGRASFPLPSPPDVPPPTRGRSLVTAPTSLFASPHRTSRITSRSADKSPL